MGFSFGLQGDDGRLWSRVYKTADLPGGCPHFTDRHRPPLGKLLDLVIRDAMRDFAILFRPAEIWLAGHFDRADLPMFGDFRDFKDLMLAVRGAYVDPEGQQLVGHGFTRHAYSFKVKIYDTSALAPAGKRSLEEIGKLVGLPKGPLAEHWIERMDQLAALWPDAYDAYARRDAEITVAYMHSVDRIRMKLGLSTMPLTVASMAAKWAASQIVDERAVLGCVSRSSTKWLRCANGRTLPRRTIKRVPVDELAHHFAAESYSGGLNVAMTVGRSGGPVFENDWSSHYPLGLVAWRPLAWERREIVSASTPLDHLRSYPGAGWLLVRFRHPLGFRQPIFAIKQDASLEFPLEGETYACLIEVQTALDHGVEVEIMAGVIVPWASDERPFLPIVRDLSEVRAASKLIGDTLTEALAKEMLNSIYGKTAQGLSGVKEFQPMLGESDVVGPSPLTSSFVASTVTAICRMSQAGLLNHHRLRTLETGETIPVYPTVYAVHTDSIISDTDFQPIVERMLATGTAPRAVALLAESHRLLASSKPLFGLKSAPDEILTIRTRSILTLREAQQVPPDVSPIKVARGGHKPMTSPKLRGIDRDRADNEWLLACYRTWYPDQSYERREPYSFRHQHERAGDLKFKTGAAAMVRTSFAFDHKRRLRIDLLIVFKDGSVQIATDPFRTIAEQTVYRKKALKWRAPLRSVADVHNFAAFMARP